VVPTRMEEALRPPAMLSVEDRTSLVTLAGVMLRHSQLVARLLIEEADRAEVVPACRRRRGRLARGFRDAVTGEALWVRMAVLPGKADIVDGRISVLPLVGAGLVGLSERQSTDWPTQDGRLRRLTVLRVEAAKGEGGGSVLLHARA
jgi:regulator of nucleoside diphosphate kinase